MKKLLYLLILPLILFLVSCLDNKNDEPILSIGDTHLGGIVFYLDGNGGGLIAAPYDLDGTYEWGCFLTPS